MLKNLLIFLSITCVYFAALIILNNFGVSDFFNVVICSFILGITLRHRDSSLSYLFTNDDDHWQYLFRAE